jgi:hypothetical protein
VWQEQGVKKYLTLNINTIIIIIPRDIVCFRNICINTLPKGDNDDNNNNK